MPTTMTKRNEDTLNECRKTLDDVIKARVDGEWSLEEQLQEIRKSAIRKAIEEGWPLETVSEASGVTPVEIHEILNSR